MPVGPAEGMVDVGGMVDKGPGGLDGNVMEKLLVLVEPLGPAVTFNRGVFAGRESNRVQLPAGAHGAHAFRL